MLEYAGTSPCSLSDIPYTYTLLSVGTDRKTIEIAETLDLDQVVVSPNVIFKVELINAKGKRIQTTGYVSDVDSVGSPGVNR